MTLQDLLKPVGILNLADLERESGLSRQACWLLWTGRRPAGRRAAKKISDGTGIPMGLIMAVEADGNTKARRRATARPSPAAR